MAEWKDVPNLPRYQINEFGVVKGPRKALKEQKDKHGNLFVRVSDHGKPSTAYLHHMVMWAFEGLPEAGWQIRFKDGDHSNPCLDNLVYELPEPRQGRLKTARTCRNGHRLSMTGKPDRNTRIWAYGNRVCLTCRSEPMAA